MFSIQFSKGYSIKKGGGGGNFGTPSGPNRDISALLIQFCLPPLVSFFARDPLRQFYPNWHPSDSFSPPIFSPQTVYFDNITPLGQFL